MPKGTKSTWHHTRPDRTGPAMQVQIKPKEKHYEEYSVSTHERLSETSKQILDLADNVSLDGVVK
jgi:hypothetical protein